MRLPAGKKNLWKMDEFFCCVWMHYWIMGRYEFPVFERADIALQAKELGLQLNLSSSIQKR